MRHGRHRKKYSYQMFHNCGCIVQLKLPAVAANESCMFLFWQCFKRVTWYYHTIIPWGSHPIFCGFVLGAFRETEFSKFQCRVFNHSSFRYIYTWVVMRWVYWKGFCRNSICASLMSRRYDSYIKYLYSSSLAVKQTFSPAHTGRNKELHFLQYRLTEVGQRQSAIPDKSRMHMSPLLLLPFYCRK